MERYAALGITSPGTAASATGMSKFMTFAEIPTSIPDDILAGKLTPEEVNHWQTMAQNAYAKYAEEHNARVRSLYNKNNKKRARRTTWKMD